MLVLLSNRVQMARKSKWIEAESPDESATDVARRALEGRLTTVWDWLPLAAESSAGEIENVHQLRVSTRRATAALHLFESWLPRKRARWFRKQLKKIRKTAGEARDLDVLARRLAEHCQSENAAGCPALMARAAQARAAAQPAIRKLHDTLAERLRKRLKKLVAKTDWRSENPCPTYLEVARTGLAPLAATFFAASEGDFENILALHEFRIAGKQLRYAMEVFAAAFGPAFRKELYPIVEELQEKLGAVNDHANFRDRYLAWADDTEEENQRLVLGKLIALETAELQRSTREFRGWWTHDRAADLKSRFWQEVSPSELRCA
jgi:CHAD domain-containing protein